MSKSIIADLLLEARDGKYREFQKALVPGVENIIGVRLPDIRSIAKKYSGTKEGADFIDSLPHTYYDEYMAHGLMIGFLKKDKEEIKARIDRFLPYVDNWGVCDSFVCCLKTFFKSKEYAFEFLEEQLPTDEVYRIRFALVSFLNYYMDDEYIDKVLDYTVAVKNDDYYVKMAQAWLVSVGIAKQYEKTVKLLQTGVLSPWVHNKAIQKSKESFRISGETKEYLNTLRVKGEK